MSSEFASLIETNTRIDGSFPTPIPGLHLSRYSSRTQPGQGVQLSTLAIVAQGSKQLMLGDEIFTYDPGHYLVVSIDLPVSGRVTAASKAKPFLGMSLDLDVKQIPSLRTSRKIQRATKPDRGVFLSRMTPELLDPVLRLLRLLGSQRTVLYSHLCCIGRFFTACGVASKVSNLSEWHNWMEMPAASRKPSSG
jgi:AraC-type transcriptional regulator N-terminus